MTGKRKVLSIIGTRPEAIKMAPVIHELMRHTDRIESIVLSTAQHREMLDQTLKVFQIVPDIDLNIMRPNQTLSQITCAALDGVERVLHDIKPDVLLVQGDTTTAFAASLAAFYAKVAVGHVEAGLRSHDRWNPFPEEINRRLADVLADYYFAPTERASRNLLNEGIDAGKIFITGNTVVDALHYALRVPFEPHNRGVKQILASPNRLLLVTAHRRENWDKPLANICDAFLELIGEFSDLQIVYPVHLNPKVRATVLAKLKDNDRIHLIEPVDYLTLVHLMKRAHLILSDSGGIQEEAPTFGKPVLVMRKVTERPEAAEAGLALVVGTDRNRIVAETRRLLTDEAAYRRMTTVANPYGDGRAAQRIVEILLR
ncbi:MAG: UDP-N-acetylglucosamine 2-epimerase (non-hydrolyzing) [Verrucomicrobia bacterium]|nr:UDP-N-acetylglucosamine 2-epimerase (non-hydrolyzing) [Verrucomicrobiota bacterium]